MRILTSLWAAILMMIVNIDLIAQHQPERILLTWTEDPASSQTITWRTRILEDSVRANLSEETGKVDFDDEKKILYARSKQVIQEADTFYYHSVTFNGLKPGTVYNYRVSGSNKVFSPWRSFTTPPSADTGYSFIFFGDVQNKIASHWTRILYKAFTKAPEARFIVYAGDIINHANNQEEWDEWFNASSFIHSSIPVLAVMGNHEYIKNDQGEKIAMTNWWKPQFNYPPATIDTLNSTSYQLHYKGTRFVILNSNEHLQQQAVWLDSLLSKPNNGPTIVSFHHPVYSAAADRDNKGIQEWWQPILEKHQVDLVLQGHDHGYARGTSPNRKGKKPHYLISVSGTKMYEQEQRPWMQKSIADTQLFQIITVSGKGIFLKTYDAKGDLMDEVFIPRT